MSLKPERRSLGMEYRKHALILAVVEGLRENGSWTGRTHVQKALFLLGASGKVDVPFNYVLYKHGPFSFDLDEEIEVMRSYAAISVAPQRGFGVTLSPSSKSSHAKLKAPLSPNEERVIADMCAKIGASNVSSLERLATAAWIRTREKLHDEDEIASRLHDLKPHIPKEAALKAAQRIEIFLN